MEVYDPNKDYYVIREHETNGLGIAGFVLSLLTLFIGWIPVFGWILWILGLVFSFAGLFRRPRGLAIAGFVISLLDLVFILFLFALLATLVGVAGVSSSLTALL